VADWGRGRGLRQCSPIRQANTSWLSQIDQGDDRQDCAAQDFQRSERYGAREQWHSSKREPSRQRAVPKKPVVSSARHGHPLHIIGVPQQIPAYPAGHGMQPKNNGTPPFVLKGYLSHFRNRLDR